MNEQQQLDVMLAAHFDATADERVPVHLLAEVARRTGETSPRPAWLVGLRGNVIAPARGVAADPATRWIVIAAILTLALALAVVATGGGGGGSPFRGNWTSSDNDGSVQTLTVGSGSSPSVEYVDDYASTCAANGDPVPVWHGTGAGTLSDDRMVVEFGRTGCSTWFTESELFRFDYEASNDTLVDNLGVVWHRQPGI
jgi:hypothetical protein